MLAQHEPFEIRALDTGLGFTRSDRLTIVRVISKARPEAAKERLYALLAQKLDETPGVPPEDLVVSVVENSSADWSFGAGRAQFLTGELPTS